MYPQRSRAFGNFGCSNATSKQRQSSMLTGASLTGYGGNADMGNSPHPKKLQPCACNLAA